MSKSCMSLIWLDCLLMIMFNKVRPLRSSNILITQLFMTTLIIVTQSHRRCRVSLDNLWGITAKYSQPVNSMEERSDVYRTPRWEEQLKLLANIWQCWSRLDVFRQAVPEPWSSSRKLEMWANANLMVALPNIGGALCSTLQSLADAHY